MSLTKIIMLISAIAALVFATHQYASAERDAGYANGKATAELACKAVLEASELAAKEQINAQRQAAQNAVMAYERERGTWESTLKDKQNAIRKATASLASCNLGADTVRLLNNYSSTQSH